jgi:hypothetical protein
MPRKEAKNAILLTPVSGKFFRSNTFCFGKIS